MQSNLVDIACTLKHETPRAWLINDGDRDVWIPKSQAPYFLVSDAATNVGVITIPEWLALEKELI